MKKMFFWVVLSGMVLVSVKGAYAEDVQQVASEAQKAIDTAKDLAMTATDTQSAQEAAEEVVSSIAADQVAGNEVAEAVDTDKEAAVKLAEQITENLEFVSGEVSAADEAAKTLTVKLYGETENAAEKTLTVSVDENTDITDGEKDRVLSSLTAGTEIDIEYDPASNKATYIFVY